MDKIYPTFCFAAMFLWVLVLTFRYPNVLAGNTFLDDFVGAQLLSLLAIILTITLASVANIHLGLNRIIKEQFEDDLEEGYSAAEPVRREINQNAWVLFWVFLTCIVLLCVEGAFPSVIWVESFVYGVCALILVLNVWVLYDVYKSVYALVSLPAQVGGLDENYPETSPAD